jgi:uncharacterized membrane protein
VRSCVVVGVGVIAALPLGGQAGVLEPGVHAIQPPAGWSRSYAYEISDDGDFVVGFSGRLEEQIATRWELGGSGNTIGQSLGIAVGINADGSVVAGGSRGVGFRWTPVGGPQPLTPLPGGMLTLTAGLSSDGQYIVGASNTNVAGSRAVRWAGLGAPEFLGFLPGGNYSTAEGTNSDGSKVVGYGGSSEGERAFLWSAQGGIQSLGTIPNYPISRGAAISRDGTTAVGYCQGVGGGPPQAFRWTLEEGIVPLGAPVGRTSSFALAVSADGSVIVGDCSGNDSLSHPFMWTTELGPVSLEVYMAQNLGYDLTGWRLGAAQGVSADGTIIIGSGIYNGIQRGWVAVIPAPGVASFAVFGAWCVRRRRPVPRSENRGAM